MESTRFTKDQQTSHSNRNGPFGQPSATEPSRGLFTRDNFRSTRPSWDSSNIWGNGGFPRQSSYDGAIDNEPFRGLFDYPKYAMDIDPRLDPQRGSNGISSEGRSGSSLLLSTSESEGWNARQASHWPTLGTARPKKSDLSSNHVSPTRSRLLDNTTPLRQESGRSTSPYFSNQDSRLGSVGSLSGLANSLSSNRRSDTAFSAQPNFVDDDESRKSYNTSSYASNGHHAPFQQDLSNLRFGSDFKPSSGQRFANVNSNTLRGPQSAFDRQTQARSSGPNPYSHLSTGSLSALAPAPNHSSNPSVHSLTSELGPGITDYEADMSEKFQDLQFFDNNARPKLNGTESHRPSFGSQISFDNAQNTSQSRFGQDWAVSNNDNATWRLPSHDYQNTPPITENSLRVTPDSSFRQENAAAIASMTSIATMNAPADFGGSPQSNGYRISPSSSQANTIGRRAGRNIAPLQPDSQSYSVNGSSNPRYQSSYQYEVAAQLQFGLNSGLNHFPQASNGYNSIQSLSMVPKPRMMDQDSHQRDRSPLLQHFRGTYKTKNWELKEMRGHFIEFCSDQHASRLIQQKLETANTDDKTMIFEEIRPELYSIMTDIFGNYVIQKLFEHGDMGQKKLLANHMTGHVYKLTKQTYGCRVVQKALEHVLSDQKATLIHELDRDVIDCVKDQNGNHVIQKAIEMAPSKHLDAIIQSVLRDVRGLATDKFGCRVVQRMLEHCDLEVKEKMTKDLRPHIRSMIVHQFGNYVIQNILTNGPHEDRQLVTDEVLSNLLNYCKNKFASNVVEKALDHSEEYQKREIIRRLTTPNERGDSPVTALIHDSFGNYVIQKVLKDLHLPADRDRVCDEMRPFLARLKTHGCGVKAITAVERAIAELDQSREKQHERERDREPSQSPASTSQSSSLLPSTNASTVEGPVHTDESSENSDKTSTAEAQLIDNPETTETGPQNEPDEDRPSMS
ncbi:MAG: hypothetical protein Q9160_000386 [Pyrenula sp. 1 TL-2023]